MQYIGYALVTTGMVIAAWATECAVRANRSTRMPYFARPAVVSAYFNLTRALVIGCTIYGLQFTDKADETFSTSFVIGLGIVAVGVVALPIRLAVHNHRLSR